MQLISDSQMRGTHGWAEIDEERKREIITGISSGSATRGPVHAEIDITDRCNVACYFCNQQDVRTKDQISLPHLFKLVDELASTGLRSVRLSGGGDPLFHSGVLAFLGHLRDRDIVVDNLTTNGALLGPDVAELLVATRAREVIVSLNATDQADYQRMMAVPGRVFARVLENVKGLLAVRGQSSHPSVVIQFLLDRHNFSRLPEMYALGLSLGADRIAISTVLNIPNERIDPALLLVESDAEALRPFLEEVLRQDEAHRRLQVFFPIPAWNAMMTEIKAQIGYTDESSLFPTASSFRDDNGHCFFGWYTATVSGNGDIYPCCLLMRPDYPPLGNVINGRFVDHWNGPAFSMMRKEQREVFLAGSKARFDPSRHKILRANCVEPGQCWLKNIYFRGDESFYSELGKALEGPRRKARLRKLPIRAYWKIKLTALKIVESTRVAVSRRFGT